MCTCVLGWVNYAVARPYDAVVSSEWLQAQLWQLQFPQFSTQSQLANLVASMTAGASAAATASVKTEDS